ncbi:hypothetical protein EXIGLDRAFT_717216 [Exidia glandulosa HHB12029]|uniref:Uncharacterized protein n=1 Tax=Exidia glandulosa HHB12029 TaxID=1314781 RepID=A0A165P4H7_EXIGL|nr:hypothetical protein EXIGLDRAFT_717216 [Exidia glandulosa HHB12029]
MFGVLQLLFALFLSGSCTFGEFTTEACWQRNCLVKNDAGTLCLHTAYNGAIATACDDSVLSSLLAAHINSTIGLSIAYYNEHAQFLGPTIWPVPQPLPYTIYVCMSGPRVDRDGQQGHRTLCRTALHDNDIRDADSHAHECVVESAQAFVTDGCYRSPSGSISGEAVLPTATAFLDDPKITHAFFVMGGILTIGSLLAVCGASHVRLWADGRSLPNGLPSSSKA